MTELKVLKNFSELFDDVKKALNYYNENLKNDIFVEEENEDNQKAYKRGETIFDQMDENLFNINLILSKEKELIKFFEKCKQNKQKIINQKNKIITKLLRIKKNDKTISKEEYLDLQDEWNERREETPDVRNRRECEEMLEEIREQIQYLRKEREEFEKVKISQEELDQLLNKLKKEREKFSIENEFKQLTDEFVKQSDYINLVTNYNTFIQHYNQLINSCVKKEDIPVTIQNELIGKYNLDNQEIKLLEEWTSLKCGDIIFDSNKDNWSRNKSVFNERIIGKKQLVFLIEDEENYKFGYYLNTEIQNKFDKRLSTDNKTFEFNLKSNGVLTQPMKFEIIDTSKAYCLFTQNSSDLIWIGEIRLHKEEMKRSSYCYEHGAFDYHNNKTVLCGKITPDRYHPKRILVIQMN